MRAKRFEGFAGDIIDPVRERSSQQCLSCAALCPHAGGCQDVVGSSPGCQDEMHPAGANACREGAHGKTGSDAEGAQEGAPGLLNFLLSLSLTSPHPSIQTRIWSEPGFGLQG